MKKISGDIINLHMCTKNHNHIMYGSGDTEQDILSFWAIFCPFTSPPLTIPNIKILKKMKTPGNIIRLYIHVYNKWRSYDIWFLKYKVRQTEIFDSLENQNFNIKKDTWRYYHFTHLHHKWQSYDVWFLRYRARQTIFRYSGPFFALLPPYGPRKSKFSKK